MSDLDRVTVADPPFRPRIWGVLNVTPDSFSDGGLHVSVADAVAHGAALRTAGADVVDVGGESTRPGSHRISAETELERVVPVVGQLAAEGMCVSIDTTRAVVAREALAAGASIVNDVSGGLVDPEMLDVVADTGCDVVLMHWRAPSDRMDSLARYEDVTAEVTAEVAARVDAALARGIAAERIIADPGFGFAKNTDHNWTLMGQLDRFVGEFTGRGVRTLVGTSRKRFLGAALAATGVEASPSQRDAATAATSFAAAQAGVWAVRVHEVAQTRQALAVWAAGMQHSADRSWVVAKEVPGGC